MVEILSLAGGLAALCAPFLYPVMQYFAIREMRGMWRKLAFLPLVLVPLVILLMGVVLVLGSKRTMDIVAIGFVILASLVIAFVYLIILRLVHWYVQRSRNAQT
jgi:uncharacterized membrane protein